MPDLRTGYLSEGVAPMEIVAGLMSLAGVLLERLLSAADPGTPLRSKKSGGPSLRGEPSAGPYDSDRGANNRAGHTRPGAVGHRLHRSSSGSRSSSAHGPPSTRMAPAGSIPRWTVSPSAAGATSLRPAKALCGGSHFSNGTTDGRATRHG